MPLLKFSFHPPGKSETLFDIIKAGTFSFVFSTLFKLNRYKKNNNSLAVEYDQKKLAIGMIGRVRKSKDLEVIKVMIVWMDILYFLLTSE